MSAVAAPKRLLPGFAVWAHGLYAFSYRYVLHFTSRDVGGRWQVVAQDAEDEPIGPGGRTKAEAVRAAMDAIDRRYREKMREE